ncbi:hypothetical protein ACFO1B_50875 [Dactylosporangium siamense]|uniref:Uncharacterized protein n=1 Tax=Dactylosporangium siamense TaxID=685454 RepID=A0A919UJ66_9ACTN|nr:hypothetical protein [Dactylosporangium siamense]GIG52378.1 hypothetical protein Dsi01nite_104190 [Dactylosporangium siamense]
MTATKHPRDRERTSIIVRYVHATANRSVLAVAVLTVLSVVPELREVAALAIGVVGAVTTAATGVALAAVKRRR